MSRIGLAILAALLVAGCKEDPKTTLESECKLDR